MIQVFYSVVPVLSVAIVSTWYSIGNLMLSVFLLLISRMKWRRCARRLRLKTASWRSLLSSWREAVKPSSAWKPSIRWVPCTHLRQACAPCFNLALCRVVLYYGGICGTWVTLGFSNFQRFQKNNTNLCYYSHISAG